MVKTKSGSSKPHAQPQNAVTGRYVTQPYADRHPRTTFTEKPRSKKNTN